MIVFSNSSVFDSGCELIVNTINCHGIMGAGIALEFSLRYPRMFAKYKEDCSQGLIQPGKTYFYQENGQKILNFPTKGDDPKNPSKISFIEDGLDYFATHYKDYNVQSVAFPPLGCTNGKLDFENLVKPLMIKKLNDLDIKVIICLNSGPLSGLEKEMTAILKNIDIEKLSYCFESSEDFSKFKAIICEINKFSQLTSSKYLPDEKTYRKIWQDIKERIY